MTGFCVSMLWPGSLIASCSALKSDSVFIYAIMAAGGDLGGSLGPQLVGLVTDAVISAPNTLSLMESLGLTAEQLGMKVGLFAGMFFPLFAILVFGYVKFRKNKKCSG